MRMTISIGRPEKKHYVSVSKGVHNEKLCNLQKSL